MKLEYDQPLNVVHSFISLHFSISLVTLSKLFMSHKVKRLCQCWFFHEWLLFARLSHGERFSFLNKQTVMGNMYF